MLINHQERCETLAQYLVEHRTTVRAAAQRFGISKSTVHKDVTQTLRRVNPPLFAQVKEILNINKNERHLRGGEATKQKYLARADPAHAAQRACEEKSPKV